MEAADSPIRRYGGTCRVLFAGDVREAFSDAERVAGQGCQVFANILDAIDAAAKGRFDAVGIVMSGTSTRLRSVLKALRDNCDARLILLARMSEEPLAMQLAGSTAGAASPADEYQICPLRFSDFMSQVSRPGPGAAVESEGGQAQMAGDGDERSRVALLEKLATEDALTGLKNRRYIWEFSRQVIERGAQTNGQVTLLVFDIDDFKRYNDLYGHCAGDKVLTETAVLVRRCCRQHDIVGRIGGDEFAVVFWDDPKLKPWIAEPERRSASADHPREAIFIAKRFVKELEKSELHLLGAAGEGILTISGGLATFPRDGSTIQELFRQADDALLEAKRSGKNRIYLVGRPQSDISDIE